MNRTHCVQSVMLGVLMSIGAAAFAEQGTAAPSVAQVNPAAAKTPAAASGTTKARGEIRLDETVISGNQELPKVLYIVPWQDPTGIPTIQLDPTFTEHEVFRRLYPPAYQRELKYYDLLKESEGKE